MRSASKFTYGWKILTQTLKESKGEMTRYSVYNITLQLSMQEDLLLQKTLHVRNISMVDVLEDIKISLDKIVNAIMKLRYKMLSSTLKIFFQVC